MKPVFQYTKGMTEVSTSYCPGCTHGVAHRLIMETLDEMGLLGKTIGVAPIGCSVVAHQFMNVDMCESAHGRAPAVASGIRRVHPDKVVFTYQGDGDLASIGMGEIMHAAARGEKFSTFFINNCIYGMTGGQMAPTTLIGQRSTTCVDGRTREQAGMPLAPPTSSAWRCATRPTSARPRRPCAGPLRRSFRARASPLWSFCPSAPPTGA